MARRRNRSLSRTRSNNGKAPPRSPRSSKRFSKHVSPASPHKKSTHVSHDLKRSSSKSIGPSQTARQRALHEDERKRRSALTIQQRLDHWCKRVLQLEGLFPLDEVVVLMTICEELADSTEFKLRGFLT